MDEIEDAGRTPTPISNRLMNFGDALKVVLSGEKVTKLEWNNENLFLYMLDGKLFITMPDGRSNYLIVSDRDIIGEDWIIV